MEGAMNSAQTRSGERVPHAPLSIFTQAGKLVSSSTAMVSGLSSGDWSLDIEPCVVSPPTPAVLTASSMLGNASF
jgi:hypothetical protein